MLFITKSGTEKSCMLVGGWMIQDIKSLSIDKADYLLGVRELDHCEFIL